ncbi:hypothetical protein [Candidatus Bodocaedibacter vickermanii]|uniref:Uncharacterized protein n=1 Tax=Candidatus Bodocaedibacter vickermanii TaxID=2741701 RepID=A0A7L9RUZ2_9PROT|nr:hypothetical protein CPBP_01176 [Candidatus Paracaedibacteraceae bacterium 'Lake Konstanz']
MKKITYDDFLDIIQELSTQKDWDGLESYFNKYCAALVSAEVANTIQNVNLSEYENNLMNKAKEALSLAIEHNAKAVYFEYYIPDWSGGFYICPDYNSTEIQDDDWAANFISFRDDSLHFYPFGSQNTFEFEDLFYECEGTEEQSVVEYYLIARTTALFGRVSQTIDWGNIALCIGFHDQQIVTRIYEPQNMKVGE